MIHFLCYRFHSTLQNLFINPHIYALIYGNMKTLSFLITSVNVIKRKHRWRNTYVNKTKKQIIHTSKRLNVFSNPPFPCFSIRKKYNKKHKTLQSRIGINKWLNTTKLGDKTNCQFSFESSTETQTARELSKRRWIMQFVVFSLVCLYPTADVQIVGATLRGNAQPALDTRFSTNVCPQNSRAILTWYYGKKRVGLLFQILAPCVCMCLSPFFFFFSFFSL